MNSQEPVDQPQSNELWARLAQEMRAARQRTDLSVSQLAERISWSRSHLSNLEHGRGKPTPELVAHYDQFFSEKNDRDRLQRLYNAAASAQEQERRTAYRADRALTLPVPSLEHRPSKRTVQQAIIVATLILLSTLVVFKHALSPQTPCMPPTRTPEGRFPNPLNMCPAADPSVFWLSGSGVWYAYTSDRGLNDGAIDIFRSKDDRQSWTKLGSVFPSNRLPGWALNQTRTFRERKVVPSYWAPSVNYFDGRYILYYTSRNKELGWNEIGAAAAKNPQGPWKDIGRPVVKNNHYSVVDPAWFRDPANGKTYLLWKDDPGLSTGLPRQIVIQEVRADGLAVVGSPRPILPVNQAWEGKAVGAPSMAYHDGFYYLFYSGNYYGLEDGTSHYAVGVARASSPTGDFVKYEANPILRGSGRFEGPGGEEVIQEAEGEWLIFYHAYPTFIDADPTDPDIDRERYLMMDVIHWDGAGGWPRIHRNSEPSS